MPRPRFSNRLVADTFVIAQGASASVVIDLIDSYYPQLMVKTTYTVTASSCGITGVLYPGFAVDNVQTVEFIDNGDVISSFASTLPTPSTGTTQIKRTGFAINPELYPRYLNMVLVNNDSVNPISVRIVGDW